MSESLLDILQKNNVLDKEKAEQAKVTANKNQQPMEEVLLQLNLASEVDIAKAKAEQFKIPYVNLIELNIPDNVLGLIDGEMLKSHSAVPFEETAATLKLAMADPFDVPAIQALQRATSGGKKLDVHMAARSQINTILDKRLGGAISTEVSEALEDVEQPETEIADEGVDLETDQVALQNAPVARIVNSILQYGAKIGSSDIHIEPQEKEIRVRYRVHGVLTEKLRLPKNLASSLVARIKILSKLKIDEKRLPQDGRLPIKVGDKKFDLRVSTLPDIYGEKVVMRLLERETTAPPLETTGLRGAAYKTYLDGLKTTTGIILITGPTGSGKTRTLAASLGKLNSSEVNIVTLENPVEIRINGVNQVQINPDAGLTFASGLRSILRQDPDIIMVGEIRDKETAGLAVQSALTGHLVLSTLHTNSAAAALPRLIDMKVEPYLLASVLHMVVAQRLPRRICKHCKESYVADQEVVDDINKVLGNVKDFDVVEYLKSRCETLDTDQDGILDMKCPVDRGDGNHDIYLYKGKGCDECGGTGYSGRVGIFEVLKVTEQIGRMIMENRSSDDIQQQAIKNGMVTMVQDGYLKALEGTTAIEDVLRVCRD